jgi:hypothetical protein
MWYRPQNAFTLKHLSVISDGKRKRITGFRDKVNSDRKIYAKHSI